ncbi:ABC transporter six-transmembrane domain-containing protein [Streptomyces sp. NBC_01142]|uniref:ABC transporter six-transmembrane domain-containing protein n=1 Tax=Streptomyces sp. NBC_01142 TaxID=2975865 RepID=UPI0022564187|nr:ABC transporter six-transmembrane domain-containing protein [Streptomyces sp. NBC_01142]MCX4824579.1 ABC transporter six-transmembrane domain-containing protein [Streptomyces sp. NBC_01142]
MSVTEPEVPEPSILRRIYRQYRRKVCLTYALVVLEELCNLLYPFAIGVAINGLLKGDKASIIPFVSIWALHAVTGMVRHLYDTRVFTGMYAQLAGDVVMEQRKRNLPDSVVVARSTLSREFVVFAETHVPAMVSGVLAIVGSLFMLFTYSVRSAFYCVLLIVPIVAVNWWYSHRAYRLNKELNDQQEREVHILTSQPEPTVRRHYSLLRKWEVKLSDAEAKNWGVLEIFVIALCVLVFFQATNSPEAQAGTIFAVISYVRTYTESLDQLPSIIQDLTRLVDIARRISPGAEATPDEAGEEAVPDQKGRRNPV